MPLSVVSLLVNNVEVGSAGSGVTSTDDLDTVSHGDALIIHYNGSN